MQVPLPPDAPGPTFAGTIQRPRTITINPGNAGHIAHFVIFHVLPFAGAIAALAILPWLPPSRFHLASALAGWLLTGVGISVGYHRLFTHRSFHAPAGVRLVLAVLGSAAGQGPVSYWVAIHRRHHENSDHTGDPHSPIPADSKISFQKLWHAHMGWIWQKEVPNVLLYAPDIFRDPAASFCNRHYMPIALVVNLLPACVIFFISNSAVDTILTFLWATCFRLTATSHCIFSINSICHSFGSQPWETGDHSRNNAILAIPTLGESWHNNHHYFPRSARLGLKWWQIDLGYLVILMLGSLGLVHRVVTRSIPSSIRQKDEIPE